MPWAGQSPVKPLPVKRPERLAANSVADWKSRSTRRLPFGAHSKLTQTFANRLRNTSEPPLVNSVVSGEDASSMPRSRTAEVRRKRRLLSSPRPVYRAIRTRLLIYQLEEYCIPLGKSIKKNAEMADTPPPAAGCPEV